MSTEVCSQGDGRAAVAHINGQPLCVDCYTKMQSTLTEAQKVNIQAARHAMAMANLASAEMDSVVGIPNFSPRIRVPPMPETGAVTLNNFKMDNVAVGAINTGNVSSIDATVTQLQGTGNNKVANALRNITQAVIKETKFNESQKNELLEKIAFLSEQVTQVKKRKPGMIAAALDGITNTAKTVAGIAAAWQAAEPILRSIFR